MVGFGPKQAWLAIQGSNREAVTTALKLRDLGPVSWRTGIDLAYLTDDRVVMTPPLPGAKGASWIVVTGRWLMSPHADLDAAQLSADLGTEVQRFATYRVTELHRWERAVDGAPLRAFEYHGDSGTVTEWLGVPDQAETDIGIPALVDDEGDILVSESDVMRLAGAWSVDPTSLTGQPAPGPLTAAAVAGA
jgi:hypothetical protein